MLFNSSGSNLNNLTCLEDEDRNNKQSCMLSLFRADQTVSPDSKVLQKFRDEHGFAFDNPYFRDEASNQRYLRQQYPHPHPHPHLQEQQQQQANYIHHASGGVGNGGLLQTAVDQNLIGNGGTKAREDVNGIVQQQLVGKEQLHFIEHHISNLHNRQVTSSVKELSILGKHLAIFIHFVCGYDHAATTTSKK